MVTARWMRTRAIGAVGGLAIQGGGRKARKLAKTRKWYANSRSKHATGIRATNTRILLASELKRRGSRESLVGERASESGVRRWSSGSQSTMGSSGRPITVVGGCEPRKKVEREKRWIPGSSFALAGGESRTVAGCGN